MIDPDVLAQNVELKQRVAALERSLQAALADGRAKSTVIDALRGSIGIAWRASVIVTAEQSRAARPIDSGKTTGGD